MIGFDESVIRYRGTIGEWGTYKDIDNLPYAGYYRMSGKGPTGSWPPSSYGVLLFLEGTGYAGQIAIISNSDEVSTSVYSRVRINATWFSWASLS